MSKRMLLFLDDIWRENLDQFKDLNYSPFIEYNPINGDRIPPSCPTKQYWLNQAYNSYKTSLKNNDIVLYIKVSRYDLWI